MRTETDGGGHTSLATIADAAIRADMEHRGWTAISGGSFSLGTGTMSYDRKAYLVRDGHAEQLGADDGAALPEFVTSVQSQVFDHWPGAIEAAFADYDSLPTAGDFSGVAADMERGAGEIAVSVTSPGSTPEAPSGNGRLAQDLVNLEGDTNQLAGVYARTFHDRYVAGLSFAVASQHALAGALAVTLGAEERIWREVDSGLTRLKSQAVVAMQASGPQAADTDAALELSVAGSILGAAAAFATGGAVLALALAAAGASAAGDILGAGGSAPAPKKVPLGAGTPQGVLDNIIGALDDLDTEVRDQERDLETLLSDCLSATTASGTDGNFDLRLRGGGASPGEWLSAEQDVIVDATAIASITDLWIPTICGDLHACRSALGVNGFPWIRPAHVGTGTTGPWAEYAALQSRLDDLLAQLESELTEAAAALKEAAKGIGLSDEATTDEMARQADRINAENINEIQS
ncbi:MAG: hypothetical protein JWN84_2861 [Nocardioides sp.]|nr:hypothetical protein [Nocardioides sp.]